MQGGFFFPEVNDEMYTKLSVKVEKLFTFSFLF